MVLISAGSRWRVFRIGDDLLSAADRKAGIDDCQSIADQGVAVAIDPVHLVKARDNLHRIFV